MRIDPIHPQFVKQDIGLACGTPRYQLAVQCWGRGGFKLLVKLAQWFRRRVL